MNNLEQTIETFGVLTAPEAWTSSYKRPLPKVQIS